jgi:hypothetical protein
VTGILTDLDLSAIKAAEIRRHRSVRRLPILAGAAVGALGLGYLAIEREPDSALADMSAAPGNV